MSALTLLKNAKNKNRLSHLYLFSGNKDSNKLDLAFEFSNLILKDYDKKDNLLEQIKSLKHSQVTLIKPDGNIIKKDQILKLQETFSKTSLVNAPRIYIILDVDLISLEAANSLLKFMEEPENSKTYGILTTSNLSNVLKTIKSRAQVINIYSKQNTKDIYDFLINEDVSSYLAKIISLTTKSKEKAIAYKDDLNFKEIIDYIYNYFSNYKDRNLTDLKKIENIIYDRSLYKLFLETMLLNYYELLKHNQNTKIYINEIINEDNENLKYDYLMKNINLLLTEIKKQSYYININLSLEVLMINLLKEV